MNATLAAEMAGATKLRALVVNYNAPELNYLAKFLAQREVLAAYVRPYVNKGRLWERGLAKVPLAGKLYSTTFGRRRIDDARLASLTSEAGVMADMLGAALLRAGAIPHDMKRRGTQALEEKVRDAVANRGARLAGAANCIVAFQGFALAAFQPLAAQRSCKSVLDYPIAHHRTHRRIRLEEAELQPQFASTWAGFEGWPAGFEEQLDEEIAVADAVLVGSTFVRDSFIAAGVTPGKIETIPYGVDLNIFRPAERPRDRTDFEVVFAGQLSQRKGLSYLLRGYRKFRRHDSRLTLVGSMAGASTALAPYRDLFQHVPHLTLDGLADVFRSGSVFLFPTLLEGMPLVVLQAMACGLPVIVTDHGPADLVRDGIDGFIVPIRDEDAIAEKLQMLYDDPERRAAMGRNARERAQLFGWDQYADRVTRYLHGLVNG